jgi:Tfp pilus assembly protein FimV
VAAPTPSSGSGGPSAAPGHDDESARLTAGDPPHARADAEPAAGVAQSNGASGTDAPGGEPETTPRATHEDVMRRARELRERQRESAPVGEEHRD